MNDELATELQVWISLGSSTCTKLGNSLDQEIQIDTGSNFDMKLEHGIDVFLYNIGGDETDVLNSKFTHLPTSDCDES